MAAVTIDCGRRRDHTETGGIKQVALQVRWHCDGSNRATHPAEAVAGGRGWVGVRVLLGLGDPWFHAFIAY